MLEPLSKYPDYYKFSTEHQNIRLETNIRWNREFIYNKEKNF